MLKELLFFIFTFVLFHVRCAGGVRVISRQTYESALRFVLVVTNLCTD